MFQVGETKYFALTPIPASGSVYSYVWNWWDATTSASTFAGTAKAINIGGEPSTRELHYSVSPVLTDGQSTTINGTISANNPPTFVSPISVSSNDTYFPFNTDIAVTAIDFDNDNIGFEWYASGVHLGSGASVFVGSIDGTWRGNGKVIVDQFAGTQNVFATTVVSDRTVTVYAVDAGGGTSSVDIDLRGKVRPAPNTGIQAAPGNVSSNASSLPTERIGAGQYVHFEVYAKDPTDNTIDFMWRFNGSNGWTVEAYSVGTTTTTPDGGSRNEYLKDISGEVVSSGTSKEATAYVKVTSDTSSRELPFTVKLVKNTAPSAMTVTVKDGSGNPVTTGPVAAGTKLVFSVVPTDPDGDLVRSYWVFTQPLTLTPTTLRLWGPKVILDTTGYTGQTVVGTVTGYDRMGASLSATLPIISVV